MLFCKCAATPGKFSALPGRRWSGRPARESFAALGMDVYEVKAPFVQLMGLAAPRTRKAAPGETLPG